MQIINSIKIVHYFNEYILLFYFRLIWLTHFPFWNVYKQDWEAYIIRHLSESFYVHGRREKHFKQYLYKQKKYNCKVTRNMYTREADYLIKNFHVNIILYIMY